MRRWKGTRSFPLSPPLCWGVFSPTARYLTEQKPTQCPITGAGSARHKVTCTWAMSPLLPLLHCPPPLPDPWSLDRPRFCLLSKEEGKSFGFHLQQERGRTGHVVCRVEPGTSAQHQGLREGDRILGVNNHVVEHEDHLVVRLGWDPPQADGSQVVTSLGIWGVRSQASDSPTPQDVGVPRSDLLGEGLQRAGSHSEV